MWLVTVLVLCALANAAAGKRDWKSLNLVPDHVPMVLRNNAWLKEECKKDPSCPHKDATDSELCWGYEVECNERYLQDFPQCPSESEIGRYWMQADFGKLRGHLDGMKSRQICKSKSQSGAFLTCTKDAAMCKAKNLYLHIPSFSDWANNVVLVPKDGVIGGNCELNQEQLNAETQLKRSLTTWGFQLQDFKSLDFDPFVGGSEQCDLVFHKPVVFVQLDAVGNLYHHFCDFFNLYLTQHANDSWFGTDVQIIRWNNHPRYRDPFMEAWKAFTDSDILSLHDIAGKKVCIPDATFAFLPRMVGGLYYSTYLEYNCRGSRLMKSFSDHMLHRLGVPAYDDGEVDVIRVTFLQRGGRTDYPVFRRVLNMDALVKRLQKIPNFRVQVVSYDIWQMSFLDQLKITRNTDIFIGMHGAGLSHFMFLPDWAIAFELYNCGDIRCYRDLAGLRGLRYMTWENAAKVKEHDKDAHDKYSDNAKFWNYSFDVEEFIRLVRNARDMLLENDRFRNLRKSKTDDFQRSDL